MKTIQFLEKILNGVSIISLVIMAILVIFNAILRYFFHMGIAWSEELARICFVYMIFLGGVVLAKDKQHLKVDIVVSALKGKAKLCFSLLAEIGTLVATYLMAVGAYHLLVLTSDSTLPATGLPTNLLYIAAGFSALCYFLLTLKHVYQDVRALLAQPKQEVN